MPWKSDSQRKWGNSPAGIKAMGRQSVHEFNTASKGMDLPQIANGMHTVERSLHMPKMHGMTKHGHHVVRWIKGS